MNRYIYLILACICNTLFRYYPFCFQFGEPVENHTSYAVCQAASYIFLLLFVRDKPRTRFGRMLYTTVMWCAVSNLMDELFFDPLRLGWNEIVFAIIIIVHEYIIYRKDGSKTTY